MIDCKYADTVHQSEDAILLDGNGKPHMVFGTVKCLKLTSAAGFICSVFTPDCNQCDARVSLTAKTKTDLSVDQSKLLSSIFKGFLKARLIPGDCPFVQVPNPIDLKVAFGKFCALSTQDEQLDLLLESNIYQRKIPVSEGGHPEEVITQKIAELTEMAGLTDIIIGLVAQPK